MTTIEHLHGEPFELDPFPAWRRLRDEQPVFVDDVDGVFVLTRHADVRAAFNDAETFSNRVYRKTLGKVFGPTLLQMDGRDHVRRRAIVAPVMMGVRLDPWRPLIDAEARALVEAATGGGPFDLVAQVSKRLPGAVIAAMLGLPREDREQFFAWYEAMIKGLWVDEDLQRRGRRAHLEFVEYVTPLVEARRAEPGTDLISRLAHAEVDGERFDPESLAAFISLLLTAGGETTDKSISSLWWLLLTEPGVFARVRDRPELLDAAYSEALRLFPPLPYLGREATRDVELHGVRIPQGATVRLAVASANRDERVFADPDRFVLERPDLHLGKELRTAPTREGRSSHLAFGAGAHFCIGYELARAEAVAVSRHLLDALGPSPALLDGGPPRIASPALAVDRLVVQPS